MRGRVRLRKGERFVRGGVRLRKGERKVRGRVRVHKGGEGSGRLRKERRYGRGK